VAAAYAAAPPPDDEVVFHVPVVRPEAETMVT